MSDDKSTIKVVLEVALAELMRGDEVRSIAARVIAKLKKYGYFSERAHDRKLLREFLVWCVPKQIVLRRNPGWDETDWRKVEEDVLVDQFLKEKSSGPRSDD